MDKAVVKALKLLEALSASDRPRGVTELARDVGLTKANVHRILRTLVSQGYVARDPAAPRYGLSLKMWELGSRVIDQFGLSDVARPHMRGLLAETGESVHLAVLDRDTVVYIDKADSPIPPLRAITLVGERMPAYCVSAGKALLAFSEAAGASALRFPLKKYTPETLVSREDLERQFALIRRNGYAVNRSEWRLGVWGIAAPIVDRHGSVVAAIGVWGSEVRFREALPQLSRNVVKAAARISAGLNQSNKYAALETSKAAARAARARVAPR